MTDYKAHNNSKGYIVIPSVYTPEQVSAIIGAIENADSSNDTFRKSKDLFAIRQFLKEIPEILPMVFNETLRDLLKDLMGENAFVVKSIYFDKPGNSNWFVAYHQDLTISVDKKVEIDGFGPWTVKQNQFAVQPPLLYLENIFTIRIHLDDTNENNGALKVVPGSHAKGIYRPETVNWSNEIEETCNVPQGGVMIMKPLLLHSSGRTINNERRRVIHIEFTTIELPKELNWSERLDF
jgi:ectoine hydroxylase-related dioxygenase (phytanoyl-CoA dioxygenase family)